MKNIDAVLRYLTGESGLWDLKAGAIENWYSGQAQPSAAAISAAELPAMKAEAITAIKTEAGRRILAIAPEWKQRNNLARFAELLDLPTLTQAEQDEKDALKAAGQFLRSIRTASDQMEAQVSGFTTLAFVEEYIAGIGNDTATTPRTIEWPQATG